MPSRLPCALLSIAAGLAACDRGTGLPSDPTPDLAIVGVTVVHPALEGAAAAERDRTVVVSAGRIVAVGPAATTPAPPGAVVIDGRHRWLIPGLIDAHVHFFQSGDPFTRPDAFDFRNVIPYTWEDARNRHRLTATFEVYLASGVTSVVDTGGPMWNFEVRARAAATAAAPRVEVAGPLVSMIEDLPLDLGDPPIVKCGTPDEARAVVSAQLGHHPDFIKVWFIHQPGDDLAAQTEIVRAAADAAHAARVRLLVHATELDTAKAALTAGADILVHSVFDRPIDEELIALARARHAIYIPTLWVEEGYGAVAGGEFPITDEEARLADPEVLALMRAVPRPRRFRAEPREPAASSLVRVVAAGIPVALGTDAGNPGTLPGPAVFREARLMVAAGLSPAQVLRAATVGGAAVLGLSDQLGDVLPGRLADLVLLDGDPLASVDNLSRARLVIRAGRAFDPAALLADVRAR